MEHLGAERQFHICVNVQLRILEEKKKKINVKKQKKQETFIRLIMNHNLRTQKAKKTPIKEYTNDIIGKSSWKLKVIRN